MGYKNQHWIPSSYLEAWCDPESKDKIVHIYGADGVYRKWKSYRRIFSRDDLYTVLDRGARDVRTEKAFKLIEDEFLRFRRAIERNEPLPAATKKILAFAVAAMRNRSPAARDHWQSFKDRVVEVGDQMATGLANASRAKRETMRPTSVFRASDRSDPMSLEEASAIAAEPFGKWVLRHVAIESRLLQQMSFAIMKAPDGLGFITSDSPVVWHDAAPPGKRHSHLGLGHASIEVSMPVSPQYSLLFDHFGKDGTCTVSQNTVDMFNSRTLAQCDDCFVAQNGKLAVDWANTNDNARA